MTNTAKKYRIDYSKELNSEQLTAVTAPCGPVLVIAGAGSGKTRALTYRVAYLMEVNGVPPENILLLTFTNKAAKEMTGRVFVLTEIHPGRMWGGTFHSCGCRILRSFVHRLGFESNFTILDEDDALKIMNECIEELGFDTRHGNFPKGRFVIEAFSYARNTGIPFGELIETRHSYYNQHRHALVSITDLYQRKKKYGNTVDFDDLLILPRDLLRGHEDIRDKYSEMFRHVLIDEYQDICPVQAELIDLLSSRHKNVFAVGDPSQSIYKFRGADNSIIFNFQNRYPETRIIYLQRNYRSTGSIISFANRSIRNNESPFKSDLKAMKKRGCRPKYVVTADGTAQAQYVAVSIAQKIDMGTTAPEDIAVLYRAHFHSMELQMELTRQRIPFVVRSGLKFFQTAHVRDVSALLRVLSNPRDEVSWKRIFGLCTGIGPAYAQKLWRYISDRPDPVTAALAEAFLKLVPRKGRADMSWIREVIRSTRDSQAYGMIVGFLEAGYGDYLRAKYDKAESREDDIRELAMFSTRFESLPDFLAEMALVSSDDEQADERGKVVLSTAHASKGLEWEVVYLINVTDGHFPLERALQEPGGEEEERRLFYVASTRAMEELHICAPMYDFRSRAGDLQESRFIAELEDAEDPPYDLEENTRQ